MNTTAPVETSRVPGASAPGAPPRAPFGGKRRLCNVVPVRFERSFLSQLFNAGELFLRPGDSVVVDTSKGPALAEVCGIVERRVMDAGQVGRIIRRASPEDQERHQANRVQAREAFRLCVQRIRARRLDMKLCAVEYMLDRSRVLFYFSAERRVDFRQLVRDLARQLNARIEMRQVGVRDGAGLIGGIGPCGKELCCSSFLSSFRAISIRHAKDQGLTLNPKKVSGMCGRLMCCLVYEHPTYRKAKKGAPRVNRAVSTAAGQGVVTEVQLLQRQVRVLLTNGSTETFPYAEVVVDNDTILRPRDLRNAAPKRSRRQTTVTRAGSNLREEYVWEGAEAESPDLSTAAANDASAQPSSRRRKSKRRSSRRRRGPAKTGAEAEKKSTSRSRRRRRRRSSRRRAQKPDGQTTANPPEGAQTDAEKSRAGDSQGPKAKDDDGRRSKPKRRRRRRSRRSGGQKPSGGSQGEGDQ